MSGNGIDDDSFVVGSGFGGSVAVLCATEKSYRVWVLQHNRGH
jgi:UDP-galactopyranose mutase